MDRFAGTVSSTAASRVRSTGMPASSGSRSSTGSSNRRTHSSTRIIAATAVTGLVIEPIRQMVSRAMGWLPSMVRLPMHSTCASPRRLTTVIRPGRAARSTCPAMTSCMRASRAFQSPELLIEPATWLWSRCRPAPGCGRWADRHRPWNSSAAQLYGDRDTRRGPPASLLPARRRSSVLLADPGDPRKRRRTPAPLSLLGGRIIAMPPRRRAADAPVPIDVGALRSALAVGKAIRVGIPDRHSSRMAPPDGFERSGIRPPMGTSSSRSRSA